MLLQWSQGWQEATSNISSSWLNSGVLLQVGQAIVDAGHRVLTGGLAGVMDAAMKGARSSYCYREGDTIAVLPGEDPAAASSNADIVICTGLGSYRNGIVGRADAVIAVGGSGGTLQEICIAWKAARLVVVMAGVSGATSALAGKCIDGRGGPGRRAVLGANTAEQAVQLLQL